MPREKDPIDTPVMTTAEVAVYLKVHPSTIYRLAKHGQIPAMKFIGDWRFNREEIDKWRFEQEGKFK